jgi:hypothetical protein
MESLTAVFESLLAWATFAAAIALFAVTAGPMSLRPFVERLLLWCVAMGMLGASLFRLFGMSDGHVTIVAYVMMLFARSGVVLIGTWMVLYWLWQHSDIRTPAQWLGDKIVGYRR